MIPRYVDSATLEETEDIRLSTMSFFSDDF